MPVVHEVVEGECISSISYEAGLFWETVWNDGANSDLRQKRTNPNVLSPGDKVTVPDKRVVERDCSTEKRHRFRMRGVPAKLSLCILVAGEPRANEPYVIVIDGKTKRGTTGGGGELTVTLPPNASGAKLTVGEGEDQLEYTLALRSLPPITELKGVQRRLENLGYVIGPEDPAGPNTSAAVAAFQKSKGMEPTGEIDDQLRQALQDAHGV